MAGRLRGPPSMWSGLIDATLLLSIVALLWLPQCRDVGPGRLLPVPLILVKLRFPFTSQHPAGWRISRPEMRSRSSLASTTAGTVSRPCHQIQHRRRPRNCTRGAFHWRLAAFATTALDRASTMNLVSSRSRQQHRCEIATPLLQAKLMLVWIAVVAR
jgi:hypothetical protein